MAPAAKKRASSKGRGRQHVERGPGRKKHGPKSGLKVATATAKARTLKKGSGDKDVNGKQPNRVPAPSASPESEDEPDVDGEDEEGEEEDKGGSVSESEGAATPKVGGDRCVGAASRKDSCKSLSSAPAVEGSRSGKQGYEVKLGRAPKTCAKCLCESTEDHSPRSSH